jgi:hypothetical protein
MALGQRRPPRADLIRPQIEDAAVAERVDRNR